MPRGRPKLPTTDLTLPDELRRNDGYYWMLHERAADLRNREFIGERKNLKRMWTDAQKAATLRVLENYIDLGEIEFSLGTSKPTITAHITRDESRMLQWFLAKGRIKFDKRPKP